MKKYLFSLFILTVLAAGIQAQDESFQPAVIPGSTTLLDTAFLMPSLSNRAFTFYFRKKGTAFLDMVVADKELLYVEVEEIPGIYLYSKFKVEEIKTDSLKNEAHSRFKFKFRNISIFPRYVNIKIRHRIAPIEAIYVMRDTIYVDTIQGEPVIVDLASRKIVVNNIDPDKVGSNKILVENVVVDKEAGRLITVYDSVFFEAKEIKSIEITIAPQRDLTHSSKAIIPFQLPTDQRVFGWAYWVGVGEGAKAHFDGLTEILPEDWVSAGINTPLHAYAKGLISRIPSTNIGERIDFIITDSANAVKFLNNREYIETESVKIADSVLLVEHIKNREEVIGISFHPPNPSHIKSVLVDFGKTEVTETNGSKIYICLSNPNSVTALSVAIKVVALLEKSSFIEQATQAN